MLHARPRHTSKDMPIRFCSVTRTMLLYWRADIAGRFGMYLHACASRFSALRSRHFLNCARLILKMQSCCNARYRYSLHACACLCCRNSIRTGVTVVCSHRMCTCQSSLFGLGALGGVACLGTLPLRRWVGCHFICTVCVRPTLATVRGHR